MIDVLPTLVVDSDQTCLEFTSNLLAREGHTCTCVSTIDEATVSISEGSFGLVVADTRMPGNEELQLVKKIQDITARLPFILIADEPSINLAIRAIQLPVIAYLTKPLDANDFLHGVKQALDYSKMYSILDRNRQDIKQWIQELDESERSLRKMSRTESKEAINHFVALSLKNIFASLNKLRLIQELQTASRNEQSIHLAETTVALFETVDVLRNSKSAFKSKEIGAIRKKLEQFLAEFDVKHLSPESEIHEIR